MLIDEMQGTASRGQDGCAQGCAGPPPLGPTDSGNVQVYAVHTCCSTKWQAELDFPLHQQIFHIDFAARIIENASCTEQRGFGRPRSRLIRHVTTDVAELVFITQLHLGQLALGSTVL